MMRPLPLLDLLSKYRRQKERDEVGRFLRTFTAVITVEKYTMMMSNGRGGAAANGWQKKKKKKKKKKKI